MEGEILVEVRNRIVVRIKHTKCYIPANIVDKWRHGCVIYWEIKIALSEKVGNSLLSEGCVAEGEHIESYKATIAANHEVGEESQYCTANCVVG